MKETNWFVQGQTHSASGRPDWLDTISLQVSTKAEAHQLTGHIIFAGPFVSAEGAWAWIGLNTYTDDEGFWHFY